MIPQVTIVASSPRCLTSRPPSATDAAPASAVASRPTAIAHSVLPVSRASSAAGAISRVMPGGCTTTKSRYGSTPWTSQMALPKSAPSS